MPVPAAEESFTFRTRFGRGRAGFQTPQSMGHCSAGDHLGTENVGPTTDIPDHHEFVDHVDHLWL